MVRLNEGDDFVKNFRYLCKDILKEWRYIANARGTREVYEEE